MSFVELPDDTVLPVETRVDQRQGVAIRDNLTRVESALSEFDRVSAGLAALRETHPPDLVFDVTTAKGMAEAVAHRAAWRDPRITVEKFRKAAKAPVLALGKDIDARAAWITDQLLLGEVHVQEQIKAEEDRKAKAKADREAAEFGRVLAIQDALAEFSMHSIANGLTSSAIATRIAELRAMTLDVAVYQEMMPQADASRNSSIAKLEIALKARQWDEAQEEVRLAAEATRKAEQANADAERARINEEQRMERERLALERAEMEKKQAEMNAQAKAAEDAQLAAQNVVIPPPLEVAVVPQLSALAASALPKFQAPKHCTLCGHIL